MSEQEQVSEKKGGARSKITSLQIVMRAQYGTRTDFLFLLFSFFFFTFSIPSPQTPRFQRGCGFVMKYS